MPRNEPEKPSIWAGLGALAGVLAILLGFAYGVVGLVKLW